MPLSAVTGAWGSIRLNITKRHVRDPPLAGIDHPDALTAGRRRRGCACVTHGGPGQHGASSRPALAGRRITRAGHKRESPPPLLADLDCAVRGPGPVTPRLPGALSLTASPPHRGSACHRPKSHAPGTFALAARRAGCGRGNRRLARTRADGELRRGGRSRAVCRNRCAGRMGEGAGEPGDEAADSHLGEAAHHVRVRPGCHLAGQLVYPGQREDRGLLPGRGKRQVGIQGREHGTAGTGRVPAQPQPGTPGRFRQICGLHPGQPGAGPAAGTRPVIPRGRRIWRRPAVRRLRQGAAAGIGRHQS